MNGIRTSYAALHELTLDEESARLWLAPDELAAFGEMRSPLRRGTFLAGRILVKRLLIASPHPRNLARRLSIASRSTRPGHGERPVLSVFGVPRQLSISIAHSNRGVLVALGDGQLVSVGVDLVERDAVNEYVHWTFTTAERRWLAGESVRADELWARKEALYKACQRGEGFRPAAIEVVPNQAPQYPDLDTATDLFHLQSWRVDGHLAALAVASPRPAVAGSTAPVVGRAA